MSTHTIDAEEIIDGYKSAVEHANGHLFASMLKVSHADGWFTVRDLDGTESRYRQKEILSVTRELLKQPAYKPESLADILAEVQVSKVESVLKIPPHNPSPGKTSPVHEALQDCASHSSSFPQAEEAPVHSSEPRVMSDSAGEVALSASKQASTTPLSTARREPALLPTAENVVAFPAPAAKNSREMEDRFYKRNLRRIFFIVGAAFGALIVFLLLKSR
jgi:hypothetical protein